MEKVAIIADTASNFSSQEYENLEVELITLDINFSDKSYGYLDKKDYDEFYEKLESQIPSTSAPSPGQIIDTFTKLLEKSYDKLIVLPISKGLSSFYSQLCLIANMDQFKDKVYIVDTKTVSLPLGLMLKYACQLRSQALSAEEICRELEKVSALTGFFGLIDDLKYLIKGGRIGRVTGKAGSILSIKPIISTDFADGQIKAAVKVRGYKKGQEKMAELLKEVLKGHKRYYLALGYGWDEKGLEEFKSLLENEIENAEFYLEDYLSPVIQVHSGPGILACAYLIIE